MLNLTFLGDKDEKYIFDDHRSPLQYSVSDVAH